MKNPRMPFWIYICVYLCSSVAKLLSIFKFRHADAAVDQAALASLDFFQLVPERLLEIEGGGDRRADEQDKQVGALFRKLFLALALGYAFGNLAQFLGHERDAVGHFLAAGVLEAVLVVKGLHRREHLLVGIHIHVAPLWQTWDAVDLMPVGPAISKYPPRPETDYSDLSAAPAGCGAASHPPPSPSPCRRTRPPPGPRRAQRPTPPHPHPLAKDLAPRGARCPQPFQRRGIVAGAEGAGVTAPGGGRVL